MKLLLDTHVLIWTATAPGRLSPAARRLIEDTANDLAFSSASLWEIAFKRQLSRDDFRIDPVRLWRGLIENGYAELPLRASHAVAIDALPNFHKDLFDRILIAQAKTEGMTLLTADRNMGRYGDPVLAI